MENFNIDAYLRQAEADFSGANGYSNFESNTEMDLAFNGGDDYMSADGGERMAAPAKQASPYQLQIANSTSGSLTAILFGANQYLLSTNYGSGTGITITPTTTNVTYLMVLMQTIQQPFETSLIRISSSNTTQVQNQITITTTDANGQSATIPLIATNYFSANQYQATIIDVPYSIKIDGNTSLSFSVAATTTVTMTFFPANKVNVTKLFNAQPALQQYATPRVNVTATPVYVAPRPASLGA